METDRTILPLTDLAYARNLEAAAKAIFDSAKGDIDPIDEYAIARNVLAALGIAKECGHPMFGTSCAFPLGHEGEHEFGCECGVKRKEQSEEPPGTVIKEDCVSLTPRVLFSILHGPGTDAANGYDAINPAVKEGWEKLALFVERMTRQMIAQRQTIQANDDTASVGIITDKDGNCPECHHPVVGMGADCEGNDNECPCRCSNFMFDRRPESIREVERLTHELTMALEREKLWKDQCAKDQADNRVLKARLSGAHVTKPGQTSEAGDEYSERQLVEFLREAARYAKDGKWGMWRAKEFDAAANAMERMYESYLEVCPHEVREQAEANG